MSCSVPGCSSIRRFKPEGISFHTFPRGGELLQSWLNILGKNIQTWTWSRNKLVCSLHFSGDDFILTGERRVLKANAVPVIASASSVPKDMSTSLTSEGSSMLSVGISDDPEASKHKSRNIKIPSLQLESSSTSTEGSGTGQKVTLLKPKPLKRKLSKPTASAEHESSTTSTDSSGKRRKIAFVKAIHNYSISPRKIKLKNEQIRARQAQYRKKLYVAKKNIALLQKEVKSLKSVVQELSQQRYLSEFAVEHLGKTYESVPHVLMSRYLKNVKSGVTTHETYPPALRQFASVLQFYSSKAYEYVRQNFALALPSQATIRKWYSNVDCLPGFIQPAFDVLKIKQEEASKMGRTVVCSLLIDEISIKKQIEFDGQRMWGYVDFGVVMESDEIQPATEAFVVMLVAHQSHWKIPIAYFFIKSLTGREKANIINECLTRIYEVGIKISSVTCDGPSANFSMLKELGCVLDDVHNMKTWFSHPADSEQLVFCILDVCHMLKLLRNLLAKLLEFLDPEGGRVSWRYIKALHEIQENEMFTIGNKLKRSHIEWYRQKMKVNLAAQTLSRSVADALDFLRTMGLPQFQGCEATVNFIRKADQLFDLLNSRSPWAKGFKAPMRVENEQNWRGFLEDTVKYLLNCKDVSGRPLWSTPHKTPIVGFAMSAMSFCGIFDNFVKNPEKRLLDYLLTYKCSQDHLEIFFCSVRSRNGWINNPTALQFTRTFKRLLLHSSISGRGGNCKVLDTTTILTVPSTQTRKDQQKFDISLYRKYNLDPAEHLQDHDYDVLPHFIELSDISSNVVTYISGFVIKMLHKVIKCDECLVKCGTAIELKDDPSYKFLFLKNRGGLFIPSKGVTDICTKIEIHIRKIVQFCEYKLPGDPDFLDYFKNATAPQFFSKINQLFPNLEEHFLDNSISEENHGFILIKEIIRCYCRIRFFNLAKRYTTILQGTLIRRQLNKVILFNHQ